MILGEPDQALRELESLPKAAWHHLSSLKIRVAALDVLELRAGAISQAIQE